MGRYFKIKSNSKINYKKFRAGSGFDFKINYKGSKEIVFKVILNSNRKKATKIRLNSTLGTII